MHSQTAKVLTQDHSQSISLPKEFFLDVDEVYIYKEGEKLIISPKKTTWDDFFNQPSAFDDDFLNNREDALPQEREF